MELMRDWLGGTIRNALGPVLTWNDGEAHDLQNHRPKYEDDGSNLRVPCPTPGVVQIIKVKFQSYDYRMIDTKRL